MDAPQDSPCTTLTEEVGGLRVSPYSAKQATGVPETLPPADEIRARGEVVRCGGVRPHAGKLRPQFFQGGQVLLLDPRRQPGEQGVGISAVASVPFSLYGGPEAFHIRDIPRRACRVRGFS